MRRRLRLVVGVALLMTACSSTGGSAVSDGVNLGPRADRRAVLDALRADGATVRLDHRRYFDPVFATFGRTYLVDGTRIDIYEYQDRAERRAVSGTISADGDRVTNSSIRWSGTPHFYARGFVIVLTMDEGRPFNTRFQKLLGPNLSPDAFPSGTKATGVTPCNFEADDCSSAEVVAAVRRLYELAGATPAEAKCLAPINSEDASAVNQALDQFSDADTRAMIDCVGTEARLRAIWLGMAVDAENAARHMLRTEPWRPTGTEPPAAQILRRHRAYIADDDGIY